MSARRRFAKPHTNERLEDRQMLAADLGAELLSSTDLDSEVAAVVSSSDTDSASMAATSQAINDSPVAEASTSDVVLDWNNLFNELLVADETNQNPGYASRSMAMLNLAIYDSVLIANGNAESTFYDYGTLAVGIDARLSAEAVASQAAYVVLSGLYPDQQNLIDAFHQSVSIETGGDPTVSIAVGRVIGETILATRANDGSDAVVEYLYNDEIGWFQADPLNPDVPVWGPGWGDVDTFAIGSAESFAPETTPALTSAEYAASYNEVKELGSVDSATRTADQTEAGIFWAYDRVGLGTPLSLFNDVLETIALQQGNTLEENAALYAQASVAMADAAIVAWHTKFDEQFWRPVTAIHDGDLDGNDLTEGDTTWTALGAPDGGDDIIGFTPQFPTYISGHATFGGALFGAIQEFYGTDDIAFELESKELEILLDNPELQAAYGLDLDDASRSFSSLSEAMAENGRSRVYLGIHFDFDDLVGQEVGQAVAAAVASDFLVPTDNTDDRGRRPGNDDRGPRDRRGPGDDGPGRGRGVIRPDLRPESPVGPQVRGDRDTPQPPAPPAPDIQQVPARPMNPGPATPTAQDRPAQPGGPAVLGDSDLQDRVPTQRPDRSANETTLPDNDAEVTERPMDAPQNERLRQMLDREANRPTQDETVDEAFAELGGPMTAMPEVNLSTQRRGPGGRRG